MTAPFDLDAELDSVLGAAHAGPSPEQQAPPDSAAFDLDAELNSVLGNAQPQPDPSLLDRARAFATGVADSATFGFLDEAEAALQATIGQLPVVGDLIGSRGKTYTEIRDGLRRRFQAQRDAAPTEALVGSLAGGLATGVAGPLAVARGASVARAALTGAAAGGLTGLGQSESDTALGNLTDAAVGAAAGGALGAVGQRLFGGAAATARDSKRALRELAKGSKQSAVEKVGERPTEVVEAIRKFGLRSVLGKPDELDEKVQAALKVVGPQVAGEVLDGVDNALGGTIDLGEVLAVIERFSGRSAATAAKASRRKALAKFANDLVELHPEGKLSSNQLHREISTLGEEAFTGPAFTPSQAAKLSRKLYGELTGFLESRVTEAAKVAAREGDDNLLRQIAARRQAIGDFTGLSRVKGVVEAGAKQRRLAAGGLDKSPFSPERILSAVSDPRAAGAAAVGASFLSPQAAGIIIGGRAAMAGLAISDRAMASIARRASEGARGAALVEHALSLGVPRATAVQIPGLLAPE